jgi:hypothetical protein
MAVVCLVLGMPPVHDVVAIALFALHDLIDDARGGGVLTNIVEATSKLSLFTLVMVLVDVTTSVTTTPVLV